MPDRPAFATIGVATQPMDEMMSEEPWPLLAQQLIAAKAEVLALRTALVCLFHELPEEMRNRAVARIAMVRQGTDDENFASPPGFNTREETLHGLEVAMRRLIAMINKTPVPSGEVSFEPEDDPSP